ncbi:MAG: transposase family protein, partial [Alistipes sp.]
MKTKKIDPLHLLLPKELFNYFELIDSQVGEHDIHLFLDEKSIPPQGGHYHSAGFTEQRIINDFPIRGKAVFLHIRRRKWLNINSSEVVT